MSKLKGHTLIAGTTMSGKTYLAQGLVRSYLKQGISSLVLDPLADKGWKESGAAFVTIDPMEFLDFAKRSKQCALFVDESGVNLRLGNMADMSWITTQSRHNGHLAHLLCQRPSGQIAPEARLQCSRVIAFCVKPYDAQLLAKDYDAAFLACPDLPEYSYIVSRNFAPTRLIHADGRVEILTPTA